MKTVKILALFDRGSQVFGRPFFVPTTAVAVRSLRDELKNPDSDVSKHPEDYELYEIGDYDEDDGSIDTPESPSLVVRCQDLVA